MVGIGSLLKLFLHHTLRFTDACLFIFDVSIPKPGGFFRNSPNVHLKQQKQMNKQLQSYSNRIKQNYLTFTNTYTNSDIW